MDIQPRIYQRSKPLESPVNIGDAIRDEFGEPSFEDPFGVALETLFPPVLL